MHNWGDTEFDWKGLNDAINFLYDNLIRWGRVPVRDAKEKWGTARIYCSFGWYSPHTFFYPGYAYNQYPWSWLWSLDVYYGNYLMRPINWFIVPYHQWLYRKVYQRAVLKWPHLYREILVAADYPELLEGFDCE